MEVQTSSVMRDHLQRLTLTLPAYDPESSMVDQALSVLHLLSRPGVNLEPMLAEPTQCPNCGLECHASRTPYCSMDCREESSWVRQMRASLASDEPRDQERLGALGQKLWRLLGGGMPLRVSLIPPSALARTLKSRGGVCETCGAPATTVDNVGSG